MSAHQICPKWPWAPWRSDLSKVLSTVSLLIGSVFWGWLLSLIGEQLVAKVLADFAVRNMLFLQYEHAALQYEHAAFAV